METVGVPPPQPQRTNCRRGEHHSRGLDMHAGFLDGLSLQGGGGEGGSVAGHKRNDSMDGATSPFEGESIPRAFHLRCADTTPPRLAATPDAGPHPAYNVRPPCWPVSWRRQPASQHHRGAAVEQGREAASGWLRCRAPALGPHGLTHGRHSCRTHRGGHSVLEVTGGSVTGHRSKSETHRRGERE